MAEAEHTLDAELGKVRELANARWSEEAKQRVQRFIAEVEESTARGALGVGERAPDFVLRAAVDEREVRLSEALGRGPVVLSFYRGHW